MTYKQLYRFFVLQTQTIHAVKSNKYWFSSTLPEFCPYLNLHTWRYHIRNMQFMKKCPLQKLIMNFKYFRISIYMHLLYLLDYQDYTFMGVTIVWNLVFVLFRLCLCLCVFAKNGHKEKGVNSYPGKKTQCRLSGALLNTLLTCWGPDDEHNAS